MAFRTTEDDVRDILSPGGDYKPGKPMLPFLRAANNMVNWIQANAANYGKIPNDAATAKELEGWIAAWAYKCSDQQYSSASQKSSASFRGATGDEQLRKRRQADGHFRDVEGVG